MTVKTQNATPVTPSSNKRLLLVVTPTLKQAVTEQNCLTQTRTLYCFCCQTCLWFTCHTEHSLTAIRTQHLFPPAKVLWTLHGALHLIFMDRNKTTLVVKVFLSQVRHPRSCSNRLKRALGLRTETSNTGLKSSVRDEEDPSCWRSQVWLWSTTSLTAHIYMCIYRNTVYVYIYICVYTVYTVYIQWKKLNNFPEMYNNYSQHSRSLGRRCQSVPLRWLWFHHTQL